MAAISTKKSTMKETKSFSQISQALPDGSGRKRDLRRNLIEKRLKSRPNSTEGDNGTIINSVFMNSLVLSRCEEKQQNFFLWDDLRGWKPEGVLLLKMHAPRET